MPFVKIDITKTGATKTQKQQLIKGVTQLLKDVLDKDVHLTHVVINEIDTDNWGIAGEQVSDIPKQQIKLKK